MNLKVQIFVIYVSVWLTCNCCVHSIQLEDPASVRPPSVALDAIDVLSDESAGRAACSTCVAWEVMARTRPLGGGT